MWRLGLIAVLAGLLDLTSSAAVGYEAPLQRLKRSPPFCPPYYPPPPPPHHPPFWPPPPPPPYFFRHGYGNHGSQNGQGQSYVGGLTAADESHQGGQSGQDQTHQNGFDEGQGNAGQFGQGGQKQAYTDSNSQAGSKNEGGQVSFPSPPCDKCNTRGENAAISNAQSESGSAIAVAISGRNKT